MSEPDEELFNPDGTPRCGCDLEFAYLQQNDTLRIRMTNPFPDRPEIHDIWIGTVNIHPRTTPMPVWYLVSTGFIELDVRMSNRQCQCGCQIIWRFRFPQVYWNNHFQLCASAILSYLEDYYGIYMVLTYFRDPPFFLVRNAHGPNGVFPAFPEPPPTTSRRRQG